MTKKDYELIAGAIDDMFLGNKTWSRTLEQVVDKFASTLENENPKFQRTKFMEACGIVETYPCERCGGVRDCEARICNNCVPKENI